jgi:hypothetical protein
MMQRKLSSPPGFGRLRKTDVLAALAGLLLLTNAALAANGYEIRPFVIGGGGGHSEMGDYVLDGIVGQAVTGVVEAAPYELSAGFWCGKGGYEVLLPLVLRAAQ